MNTLNNQRKLTDLGFRLMQNYIDIAEKKGLTLLEKGNCQFCGAKTTRGVHECVEIFSLGFSLIDYSQQANHLYRFMSVDAHTLQHPEIHGRWNNHFHLTRQHLMYEYKVQWKYNLSSNLSDCLNAYKKDKEDEYLLPPKIYERGKVTTTDIINRSKTQTECQEMIKSWGVSVYSSWYKYHNVVDQIALSFMESNKAIIRK